MPIDGGSNLSKSMPADIGSVLSYQVIDREFAGVSLTDTFNNYAFGKSVPDIIVQLERQPAATREANR